MKVVIGVTFVMDVPVIQLVGYYRLVKKYGKEIAEKAFRRY